MTYNACQQRRKQAPAHFIKTLPGERSYDALKCFVRFEQMYGRKSLFYVEITDYIGGNHKQTQSLVKHLIRKKLVKKDTKKQTVTAKYSLTSYGRKMFYFLEELEEDYKKIRIDHF